MKKQKWLPLLCAVLAAGTLALSGCGEATNTPSASAGETVQAKAANIQKVGDQLEMPAIGEEIAVIETTQGTIRMRLFREQAPIAVAKFVENAEQGLYEGMPFHRIMDNFMIQTAAMTGQKSTEFFADEFSDKLLNLRGAVSMANIGYPDTNSDQFFINQAPASAFSGWDYYRSAYALYEQNPELFTAQYGKWPDFGKLTEEVMALYTEHGGNPSLDGAYTTVGLGHTVFGQVFSGMEAVDRIAAAKTDSNAAPIDAEQYQIIRVTITTYGGEELVEG